MFARFMSLRKVQIGLVIMAVFLVAAAFGRNEQEISVDGRIALARLTLHG